MIVEHEKKGAQRAEYGKGALKELSKNLTNHFGRDVSVNNPENMRRFLYYILQRGNFRNIVSGIDRAEIRDSVSDF